MRKPVYKGEGLTVCVQNLLPYHSSLGRAAKSFFGGEVFGLRGKEIDGHHAVFRIDAVCVVKTGDQREMLDKGRETAADIPLSAGRAGDGTGDAQGLGSMDFSMRRST